MTKIGWKSYELGLKTLGLPQKDPRLNVSIMSIMQRKISKARINPDYEGMKKFGRLPMKPPTLKGVEYPFDIKMRYGIFLALVGKGLLR